MAGSIVAIAFLLVRIRVPGATAGGFVIAFLLTQAAVAAIGWGRALRLFALIGVAEREREASSPLRSKSATIGA
jgi:hypothetical protein